MRVSDVISTGAMDARLHGVHEYHRELVARLRGLLGDELIGVYAGGSFALGGFDSYLSDLDVAAVGAAHVDQTTKQAIVEALRHESLPLPCTGPRLRPLCRAGDTQRDD